MSAARDGARIILSGRGTVIPQSNTARLVHSAPVTRTIHPMSRPMRSPKCVPAASRNVETAHAVMTALVPQAVRPCQTRSRSAAAAAQPLVIRINRRHDIRYFAVPRQRQRESFPFAIIDFDDQEQELERSSGTSSLNCSSILVLALDQAAGAMRRQGQNGPLPTGLPKC